jgi:hypothetical protein
MQPVASLLFRPFLKLVKLFLDSVAPLRVDPPSSLSFAPPTAPST